MQLSRFEGVVAGAQQRGIFQRDSTAMITGWNASGINVVGEEIVEFGDFAVDGIAFNFIFGDGGAEEAGVGAFGGGEEVGGLGGGFEVEILGEGFVGDGRAAGEEVGEEAFLEDGPDVHAAGAAAFFVHGGEDVVDEGAGPVGFDLGVRGGSGGGVVWIYEVGGGIEREGGAGVGAVAADGEVVEAGEEEGTEAAALFVGVLEELAFEEFVGDEGLEEIVGIGGGEAADVAEIGAEGGLVAGEESGEGVVLGVGSGGAADEGPVGGRERLAGGLHGGECNVGEGRKRVARSK